MNRFYYLIIIIFIVTTNIFSQIDLDSQNVETNKTLSRLKLSGGYFIGKYSEVGEDFPFLNFNFRATQLNKISNQFDVGLALEAGVNFTGGLFPLYAKAGPEIKVIDNIIVGANLGYLGIFIYPIPFYGLNAFYLFEISKNIFIELESGFHSSFTEKNAPIVYINFGISVN